MPIRQLIQKYTPRKLRNWLRNPRVSWQYVADRAAFALGRTAKVEVRPGWNIRCHPASRHHFAIFLNDPVQSAELDDFRTYSQPQMHLLDVGAHYGFFALAAQHFTGGRVVCVEASAKAAAILRTNVEINGLSSGIQVVEAAMGDVDGTLEMLTTGPNGSDYFVVPRVKRQDTNRVTQLTLPTVLSMTGICPSHVKIDVEGFEPEVIHGGAEFLKEKHPVLFLELHGTYLRERGIDPMSVLETLRGLGYNRFEQKGRTLSVEQMAASGFNCRFICLP